MKTLEELKAIREKMQSQVSMREEDHAPVYWLVWQPAESPAAQDPFLINFPHSFRKIT